MMTTKQAIHLLHRLQDEQFDGEYGDERREALEMAVRALEQNLVQESGGLVKDLVEDCISRQSVIDALCNDYCGGHQDCKYYPNCENLKSIEQLPSAQPERKKGKWMAISDETQTWHHCSECYWQQYDKTNFCPNCGARMDGGESE